MIPTATSCSSMSGADPYLSPRSRSLDLGPVGVRFPARHFPMVDDGHRDAAIGRAIRALDLAGRTVVAVGTGTGLVALLFAERGSRVVSCESHPVLARVAQRTIDAPPRTATGSRSCKDPPARRSTTDCCRSRARCDLHRSVVLRRRRRRLQGYRTGRWSHRRAPHHGHAEGCPSVRHAHRLGRGGGAQLRSGTRVGSTYGRSTPPPRPATSQCASTGAGIAPQRVAADTQTPLRRRFAGRTRQRPRQPSRHRPRPRELVLGGPGRSDHHQRAVRQRSLAPSLPSVARGPPGRRRTRPGRRHRRLRSRHRRRAVSRILRHAMQVRPRPCGKRV